MAFLRKLDEESKKKWVKKGERKPDQGYFLLRHYFSILVFFMSSSDIA
jgi:hypothetical protein